MRGAGRVHTRLDRAANPAFALAQVAAQAGDRGLMTPAALGSGWRRDVERRIAGHGAPPCAPEMAEADHVRAVAVMAARSGAPSSADRRGRDRGTRGDRGASRRGAAPQFRRHGRRDPQRWPSVCHLTRDPTASWPRRAGAPGVALRRPAQRGRVPPKCRPRPARRRRSLPDAKERKFAGRPAVCATMSRPVP